MTITQLEYIIAVDTEKNFARAANFCDVTQPTLSMQIKKLEEELEVVIFDRSKKPVKTTDLGKLIIEQARNVVNESYRVNEIINDHKDIIKGRLRIGVIPTLAPYLLPLFVTSFVQKYEDVTLEIDELMTDDMIKALNQEKLDVGILVTPIGESGLQEIPLFYELFVLYVSENNKLFEHNKVDYTDLSSADMWILKEGHCFRHQSLNLCADRGKNRNRILFESGSLETLKKLVDKNSGYTLLPELATIEFSDEEYDQVRNFNKPQPVREVSLVVRRTFMKKKLIELLKAEIQASVPQILLNKERGTKIEWK